MLSYTAVIVTFNRKKAVRNALLRQFKQTVPAKRIIVVDNHSTDGTKEYISDILNEHKDTVRYLRMDENLGGSGGFYYGMKAALEEHTDLIGISDDDASYDEDYFEKIIDCAENHPNDMAFCGSIYINGKLDVTAAKMLANDKTLKFVPSKKEDYSQKSFYIDDWPFVGPVFRRELIEEISLPRKDFFIWYDDSEYALRMHQNGYRYRLVSDAKIQIYQLDEVRFALWKQYYGFRNELYCLDKYSSGVHKVIHRQYMIWKKYASVFLKSSNKGQRREAFVAYHKAVVDSRNKKLGKTVKPGENFKNK